MKFEKKKEFEKLLWKIHSEIFKDAIEIIVTPFEQAKTSEPIRGSV
jgi:hypothetical protein